MALWKYHANGVDCKLAGYNSLSLQSAYPIVGSFVVLTLPHGGVWCILAKTFGCLFSYNARWLQKQKLLEKQVLR